MSPFLQLLRSLALRSQTISIGAEPKENHRAQHRPRCFLGAQSYLVTHTARVRSKTTAQQDAALATFTDTYTATTRLTVRPAAAPCGPVRRRKKAGTVDATDGRTTTKGDSEHNNSKKTRSVVVEVRFSGPQPADRPALLLRSLLKGESVVAHPVSLRRGRQPKSMKAAAVGDERSCIFPNVNRSPGNVWPESANNIDRVYGGGCRWKIWWSSFVFLPPSLSASLKDDVCYVVQQRFLARVEAICMACVCCQAESERAVSLTPRYAP